jgi:hypothetical protein
MRIKSGILGLFMLIVLLIFSLFACSAGGKNRSTQNELSVEIDLQELSQESIRGQFSMQAVGEELHILFPERDTLTLKLLVLSPDRGYRFENNTASYLDRISYTPDVDVYFGEHLYLAWKDNQDIYLYDRQSETKEVLKHISRTPADEAWWIDLISADGRLTAALYRAEGIDLFFNTEDELMHLQPSSGVSPESILKPFKAGGAARILSGTAEAGFTVYDEISRQLYRITFHDTSYRAQALLSGGPVHHAALRDNSELDILTYDPEKSELLLFSEDGPGQFNETAVTLCRGTTSVFFFPVNGRRMFVFNEVTLDRKRNTSHCLSLLYPEGSKYKKIVLFEDAQPIQRFQAVFMKGCLYVCFVQESLRLLSARFSGLDSVEDQDL